LEGEKFPFTISYEFKSKAFFNVTMEAPEPLNKKRKNPSRESVKHAIKAAKEKAEKLQAERVNVYNGYLLTL
jgi:hypothetical protein